MNKLVFSLLFAALAATTAMQGQDALINTLRQELDRNFQVLKAQPIPAYYISLRYQESTDISCRGRMGHLINTSGESTPSRSLTPFMRVGSRELDNTHEIRGSGGFSVGYRHPMLPEDANPTVLKRIIWSRLDQLYNSGYQQFEKVKANIAVKVEQEDKSADFTDDKPEKYYEKPLQKDVLKIDLKTLEGKARKYSAVFNLNDDLIEGYATIGASTSRKIFIDTEGREIAENQIIYSIQLQAETQAEDGMRMPLVKTWFASAVGEMPSDDEVIKAAREMSALLSELKKAPVAESFTGPALLAPAAAGVFFHEIFGHRIEGARLKQESDAQTFKKKVNEEVLPTHLSVTFDPSKKYYGKTALNGYYAFDDEGIRGQKVEVVKDGILKNFLMSRTPIDGFPHSNGHGRGAATATPVTRQSNMFVESSHQYSEADLIKMLKEECRKQGKEFAFYFKEVSGGFTQTGRVMPNAFNITPLLVYRIFPDGRPNELVRGVDLVGTPLAMFAQIEACSKDKGIFNGFCGAESGSVPVATVAPALLVKTIETQKKGKSQNKQIILPKPAATNTKSVYNETVIDAIKAETDRELSELALPGLKPPFFISATITDLQITTVNATNGSLITSGVVRQRPFGYRLLVGDYQRTDENFQAMVGRDYNTIMSLDDTPESIRYSLWRAYDGIYKATAETFAQKEAAIKRFNEKPKDLDLPDWDKTPVVVTTDKPAPLQNIDRAYLEKYAKEVSAVFNDFPDVIESNVAVNCFDNKRYFYNTEQSATQSVKRTVVVSANARTMTEGGQEINRSQQMVFGDVSVLPPVAEMQKRCREFAETIIEERNAQKIDETYIGPVLFEQDDVATRVHSLFFQSGLEASRRLLTSQGSMFSRSDIEELMGKRVAAKTISIEDLSGTPEYKGVKLLGSYSVDAQAVVPPKEMTLVDKGILKNLLSDRTPSLAVPHSNGHALTNISGNDISASTGVVRLTCSVTKPYSALKDTLLKLAAEEGYDYAFIVKNGGGFYRVNVADGKETRLRSAEFQDFGRNSFKRVTAVSDTEQIYNGLGKMLNVISVISPDAMLFEDVQIRFTRSENLTKPPIVPRD